MSQDACEVTVADVDLSAYNVKTIDFTTMGDVTLTLSEEAAGAIWNDANGKNNDVFFCTNVGLENIAVQAAAAADGKGWSIVDGQGLFLGTGAGRCAAISGIKAGQIVEFIYTGDGFYTKSDNSDAGIAKTALNEATGRAIYQADEDGMIGFEIVKGNAVKQINIYESASTSKTIFLKPGVWAVDNARFAAYTWNDSGNAWFDFVLAEEEGVYTAAIPESYTGLILVRLNGETTENNWDNKWNQTDDIDFTQIADQTVFTITGWGEGEGAKSTYTTDDVPAVETVTFDFSDPNFRDNIGESMTDTKGYIYNETYTINGTSLQITAGSAPSRIYKDNNRGQCLVTYKEYCTLTFKAPWGKAIKKIEFTAAGNSNINNFSASTGTIEGMTWTGNAEGVRFLQGGTSYLANAIVTLGDGAEEGLAPIDYIECGNIAEFNALENGTYAIVTLTDAEVIGKSADDYSTVWIQDATGGCWIQYTSLNDRLEAGTKVNGGFYVVKRTASGNPQMKEAEGTVSSAFQIDGINEYTTVKGTINEVNVAENLNKVVKISGATLSMTSATAGKLTLGEETIDVNNGAEAANQALHKIADWEKDKVLENITITAILVAKSATANQLLPISIESNISDYYLVGDMTEWGPSKDYRLVRNTEAEGVEEYMILNVNLTAGNKMKVAKSADGTTIVSSDDWYPTGMENDYVVASDGKYNVYFRPDYSGGEDWHYNCIYVESVSTGISAITAQKLQGATIYNLNGQRMQNNTQKGLYIVNGKKVVMK